MVQHLPWGVRTALTCVFVGVMASCNASGWPPLDMAVEGRAASTRMGGAATAAASGVERKSEDQLSRGAPAEHPEWDRLATGDGAACRDKLKELGIRFRAMPDRDVPDARGCGIPHGVIVSRGPTGITYAPPLLIDCSLAAELPAIEGHIQALAEEHLKTSIRAVTTLGSFNCRTVRGGLREHLSEHAVGNAIDLGGFVPRRGKPVTVARDYRPHEEVPTAAATMFLRALYRALRAEDALTHVIGPETRADHRDHLHLDRGEPWWRFWSRVPSPSVD